MIPRLRDWHSIAIVGALVTFFFRDILLGKAFFWEDFILQAYPFRTFAAVSLAGGELPLWNPYTFGGMPFQADIQSAVFYLPNLLLTPFVSDGYLPFYPFQVALVLHYWIAGVTMYFLAREFGLDRIYALFSGIVFALSGFMIVQAIHPSFVQQLAWYPLIFLLVHRAMMRRSVVHAVLGGVVTGLSLLAGAPQITLFLFFLLFLYAVFAFLGAIGESGWRGSLHLLWLPALAVALSLCVAAVQLLPTIELQPLSERASLTFEQAQHGRLGWQQFLTAIIPRLFGRTSATERSYWGPGEYGTFWEACFYIGIPGLIAAAFAARLFRKDPLIRFLFAVTLLSLLTALGDQFILHRFFFNFIPGFDTFRGIGRMTVLATFCCAILAGFGLRAIVNAVAENPRQAIRYFLAASAVVALIWLLVLLEVFFPNEPRLDDPALRAAALWQATVAVGFTLLVCIAGIQLLRGAIGPRVALPAFLLLQFADMHTFGFDQNNGSISASEYFTRMDAGLLKMVKEDGEDELFRVLSRSDSAMVFDRNHGLVERVFLMEGYTPLKLSGVLPPAASPHRSHDLMNVKYRAAVHAESGESGLWRVDSYLPRAFMVYSTLVTGDSSVAEGIMRSDAFDPHATVVLDREVDLELDADTTAAVAAEAARWSTTVSSYTLNSITIDVETSRNGVLVLSEVHYPGWVASVDGRPTGLYRANLKLRGVAVPAGSHTVEVSFRPRTFRIGALISCVALAGALVLLILFRRQGAR